MPITLGPITFDETRVVVREKHEEIAGRTVRTVLLTVLLDQAFTPASLEARLDAIVAAVPCDGYTTLSLRPGRRLHVRRLAVSRAIARARLTGALELKLESRDPTEEADTPRIEVWRTTVSGHSRTCPSGGNAPAFAHVTIVADAPLAEPAISDGARTITYHGAVAPFQSLVIDGETGAVVLDGEDVTPYTSGQPPRILPPQTTLVFSDAEDSSHDATITLAYRDRWM